MQCLQRILQRGTIFLEQSESHFCGQYPNMRLKQVFFVPLGENIINMPANEHQNSIILTVIHFQTILHTV